jgi:hypothetical protein
MSATGKGHLKMKMEETITWPGGVAWLPLLVCHEVVEILWILKNNCRR